MATYVDNDLNHPHDGGGAAFAAFAAGLVLKTMISRDL